MGDQDQDTNVVVDPDAAPEKAGDAQQAQAPEEEPEGTEDIEGKGKMVPLSALQAMRKELKDLKPKADKAANMEKYVNESKPYIEFLKNNPHLLQQQQAPPAPAQEAPSATDEEAEEYARDLDLYTQDGKLDMTRARRRIDRDRARFQKEAQSVIQPLREQSMIQRAEANLLTASQTKDAMGRPLEEKYLAQTVQQITGNLSREKAIEVLADPNVANLLAQQAAVAQFQDKPHTPVEKPGEPLYVEGQGGGHQYAMSEDERRLARAAGISEKNWTASAKKFQPGKPMPLE